MVAGVIAEKPRIRRATLNDLSVIGPLFDAYRTFYEKESDLPKCFAFLRERLTNDESVIFIADIAYGDGKDAPAGLCQIYPFFSSTRLCRAWVLNDLYVDARHRRAGVGAALMAAAEDYAREQCAAVMMLETAEGNTTAQALYEGRGWVQDKGTRMYELQLRADV